ncbi:tyrosyl-tRNA synthetase [Lecanora helva]
MAEAKEIWTKRAKEIRAGNQESFLTMLEKRGFINQIAGDRDDLDKLMTEQRVGIYAGIDPTAASLHVGHLLPLMVLYWSYIKGYYSCSLLGGATAQIGDPVGRTTSRNPQGSAERKSNMTQIHMQLKLMWKRVEKRASGLGYEYEWAWRRELINNNVWLHQLPVIEFLKYIGRGVRLGTMLSKETAKSRMQQGEGMSFAEFAYPLLQSWDWWHMYDTKGVQVQVGGADQFGNILAGVEAVNHIRKSMPLSSQKAVLKEEALQRPMGFTVPLLTTASGEKLGKSAGNAIWLDSGMTSAFDLYQYFLRMADADVHRYLKLLTFEPLDVLEKLMEEHMKEPSKRVAQHRLAREVLRIVHGEDAAKKTEQEHRSLFEYQSINLPSLIASGKSEQPDVSKDLEQTVPTVNDENVPSFRVTLPRSLVYGQPIAKVLYHAKMAPSRGEGLRMVKQKGVYLGARPSASGSMSDQVDFSPATDWPGSETEKYILEGDTLILRTGKYKVKVIKIVSDEEFEAQGMSAPGWKEDTPDEPLPHDVRNLKPWHKTKWLKKQPMHDEGAEKETTIFRTVGVN